MNIDYSLYLVTDDRIEDLNRFLDIIEQAVKGGVTIVQLREKNLNTGEFFHRAVAVKKITDRYNIPLIINDRLDIVQAVDAAGLHIGQKDMPYSLARKILGSEKIIGLSVSNIKEVKESLNQHIDYFGISPVFSTDTKTIDLEAPLGIEGLKKIRSLTSLPLIAIGGIKLFNAAELIRAGADGLAVVSALMNADDPFDAAINFIQTINQAKIPIV